VRQTVLLPAAVPRCASGANCVSYSTLGEPSKLSRANPGPRCFACEKQRAEFEEGGVGAQQKAAKHRQTKKPSHSESHEPEVSPASAILERRRASVRTQMESTFQEVRQRLGFETQRHWSELAIRRTAPALLGLFSVITLLAHRHMANKGEDIVVRRAAWYEKSHPTFSDALALVRSELWAQEQTFCGSSAPTDMVKVPRVFMERLTEAVWYAA
jgi:hypothetical protein